MILRASLEILLSVMQTIVYHVVRPLAVEYDGVATPQNDRHSFAHVVEVENVQ